MPRDLLVVAELDHEVAVAVAEVVELALLEESLDHGVTERLDESHTHALISTPVRSNDIPL